jgi:hypothetical protein
MGFAPGPAEPARYPGRRGEWQTGNSLDPCAEPRLSGWALSDCRLLGVGQWFESGNGYRLGPPYGPRLWFAFFRVALRRHQKVEPDNLKPVPAHFSALRLQRPLPRALVAPATLRRWLLVVPSEYTCFPQRVHRPVVRYFACTFGQCPVVQLLGDKTVKRKEPRPPIRVEALLPRWAQVTRPASAISGASQKLPWAVVSTLPWAQSDRPIALCARRNVVWQTTIDYPFEAILPATPIPVSGRCTDGSRPSVSLHIVTPLYQAGSPCTSSKGTLSTCTFGQCPFVRLASRLYRCSSPHERRGGTGHIEGTGIEGT